MDVEAIALDALTRGTVQASTRATFGPGEATVLAIDAHDGLAAVLVVQRRRDDAWIVDVAKFVDKDGAWSGVGAGGGTYGNLPIDYDPDAPPSLGPTVTSRSLLDGDGLATVGGFVIGPVDARCRSCPRQPEPPGSGDDRFHGLRRRCRGAGGR